MEITEIELWNFRNYESAHEHFGMLNVIAGGNAQGKSNLAEAIALAAAGKSFRTYREEELIRWGQTQSVVRGRFSSHGATYATEVRVTRGLGKRALLNGKELAQRERSPLLAVVFHPDDLRLSKGGPADRRRFLNEVISAVSPRYTYDLHTYARAVAQRNQVLLSVAARRGQVTDLEPWNEVVADSGGRVLWKRLQVLPELREKASLTYRTLAGTDSTLSLTYVSTVSLPEQATMAELRRAMANALITSASDEIRRGTTLAGPHRDELLLELDGKEVRLFASQGQQRTVALALRLAEWELQTRELGEPPILVLDDVMSELDPARRELLGGRLLGAGQVFVTATELSQLPGDIAAEARVTWVHRGTLGDHE